MPDPTLKPMYRMPTVFGPVPGPRNVPEEKTHLRYTKETTVLTVTARTDHAMLSALLPPRCTLDGDARLEVSVWNLSRIGWLAGRGYNIVMVRVPATFAGEEESVRGYFIPVLWESLCDPILTGREELGWPKLYAEIPDPLVLEESWRGSASWQGFRFFDIEAARFAPSEAAPAPAPMFVHKYIPKTGVWGAEDVSCITVTGAERPPTLHSIERGSGSFTFYAARWEDMPTQYPIVNRLASLPLFGFDEAVLMRASGGGDVSSQRVVR